MRFEERIEFELFLGFWLILNSLGFSKRSKEVKILFVSEIHQNALLLQFDSLNWYQSEIKTFF